MYRGDLPSFPDRGYFSVVGPNNSGKTNMLYEFFMASKVNPDEKIFVPHSRDGSVVTTSYTNWDLTKLNAELVGSTIFRERATRNKIVSFYLEQLNRHLYTRASDKEELEKELNSCLGALGFGHLTDVGIQKDNSVPAMFIRNGHGKVPIYNVGGGFNGVILVLQAAINKHVKEIYIDEPENGLEPEKQKILRDILVKQTDNKRIIVVTHSHLLLDKGRPESVYRMRNKSRVSDTFEFEQCHSRKDVAEVVYGLLGNSLEDLMLPKNYIVAEGSSDERLVNRIIELQGRDKEKVFCLRSKGIGNVPKRIEGVYNIIFPIQIPPNPYADKVICIVDKPSPTSPSEQRMVSELDVRLGKNRCHVLSKTTLEDYIPEKLYIKAGLVKANELKHIASEPDRKAKEKIKENISNTVAKAMEESDVDELPAFRDAVEEAYKLADQDQ